MLLAQAFRQGPRLLGGELRNLSSRILKSEITLILLAIAKCVTAARGSWPHGGVEAQAR